MVEDYRLGDFPDRSIDSLSGHIRLEDRPVVEVDHDLSKKRNPDSNRLRRKIHYQLTPGNIFCNKEYDSVKITFKLSEVTCQRCILAINNRPQLKARLNG